MTAVVIAYRDMGCPHRAASFAYVHAWYTHHGFAVIVEGGDDTFTRASGLNAAIRRAPDGVIVQSDPDSLVPLAQLTQAIELAVEDGLVVPHDHYLYLKKTSTAQVLAGRPLETVGPADCQNYGHGGVGNVTVFSKATWEKAGGYDERFGLWGGDDGAFAYAADAFTQPLRRIEGDMVHLWHPRLPQSNPETREYVDQFVIVAEYRDAAAIGPEAVRDLVAAR